MLWHLSSKLGMGMDKPKNIKLSDLKKDHVFEVPAKYFEELPSMIQSRVAGKESKNWFGKLSLAYKWAAPALVIVIALFFWFRHDNIPELDSVDALLAEVSTAALIDYLEESDLSIDEIIENVELEEGLFENTLDDEDLLENISEDELDNLLEDYELTGEYL